MLCIPFHTVPTVDSQNCNFHVTSNIWHQENAIYLSRYKISAPVRSHRSAAVHLLPTVTVTCLGVTIDQHHQLTFAYHHQTPSPLSEAASTLHHRNAVLDGVNGVHLRKFHALLNAAAHLIIRRQHLIHHDTRRPALAANSTTYIKYKLCTMVFNCLHGLPVDHVPTIKIDP